MSTNNNNNNNTNTPLILTQGLDLKKNIFKNEKLFKYINLI